MKYIIALIIASLIASPAYAETYRVFTDDGTQDIFVEPVEDIMRSKLKSIGDSAVNLRYVRYSGKATGVKTDPTDLILLRTPGAKDKEYATVQLALDALDLLACGDIISLEQPVGTRDTTIIAEKPCDPINNI